MKRSSPFAEVARAWSDVGIPSVLIKSPGYIPYTNSNVDVLVPTHQMSEAHRIMLELGYLELKESLDYSQESPPTDLLSQQVAIDATNGEHH